MTSIISILCILLALCFVLCLGIIFALKVLTTQLIIDGNARVFVWAEFIIANMLMPRTTALSRWLP